MGAGSVKATELPFNTSLPDFHCQEAIRDLKTTNKNTAATGECNGVSVYMLSPNNKNRR